jgi:DNA-binding response OmpR family regulator
MDRLDDIVFLLVEDEPLIGLDLAECLREGGYSVHHVLSGADAVAMLQAGDAAIAGDITDVQLGMGPEGWQIARLARQLTANIPIIYITGDSAHEHTVQGVPGSVVVQKPFAAAQILTAVSTLLNTLSPTN